MVYCGDCGDVLCGKPAHGNGGKIGYYEHSWAVRRESCLTKKAFECGSFKRIGAKKLEPIVLEKVQELLRDESVARKLLEKAKKQQEKSPHDKEIKRLNLKLEAYDRQLDALSQRLAELPRSISAAPIYKLMGNVEKEKE
ncbi:MAG: hypothetical protein VXV96_16740 [Bdellovibrionota bacterium]|nr:hypothetical protein [Bdellovibrionota bacterium]